MGKAITKQAEIVTLRGDAPFTTSLAIAEGVGLPHASVIKLIRKHREMFEELGTFGFEIQKSGGRLHPHGFEIHVAPRKQGGGTPVEFALLNEDQATFLMTLFRNSDVVLGFKLRLVKAFRRALNELARMRRQQAEPAWQVVRDETKLSFRWMAEAPTEARASVGKETAAVHYMSEARLINGVLTGKFAGINRDGLSGAELELLADLERKNALLLARGLPYAERKELLQRFIEGRRPLLGGAA